MFLKSIQNSGGGGTLKYVDKIVTPSTDTTTSVSFDFSDVPNYQNLTVDNFAILELAVFATTRIHGNFAVSNYNNSTGILTITRTSGSMSFNTGNQKVRCYYVE